MCDRTAAVKEFMHIHADEFVSDESSVSRTTLASTKVSQHDTVLYVDLTANASSSLRSDSSRAKNSIHCELSSQAISTLQQGMPALDYHDS